MEGGAGLGFSFDRHWVIVKEQDLCFVAQPNLRRMALVAPELPEAALSGNAVTADMHLTVRLPFGDDMEEHFEVPLIETDQPARLHFCKCGILTELLFAESSQSGNGLDTHWMKGQKLLRSSVVSWKNQSGSSVLLQMTACAIVYPSKKLCVQSRNSSVLAMRQHSPLDSPT